MTQIYAPNNQYQVVLQVAPEFQKDPSALGLLYVRSSHRTADSARHGREGPHRHRSISGQPYRTAAVGHDLVQHRSGLRARRRGDAIQNAASATLPSTIATRFQGTAQAFQDSLQGLGLILVMAIVVIYIVLGVLYESFTHPLTILSGLPAAGFGALLTLLIFHTDLSLYAFVGVIMLVGLVKKNGIMMVDFAVETQRLHGKTPREAIHEACLVRFRPIMMTTMAALVGTLPIALGFGAGAEARRPLGLAVVGGLLVSQLLTLYITPVYYVYIEGARLLARMPAAVPAEAQPHVHGPAGRSRSRSNIEERARVAVNLAIEGASCFSSSSSVLRCFSPSIAALRESRQARPPAGGGRARARRRGGPAVADRDRARCSGCQFSARSICRARSSRRTRRRSAARSPASCAKFRCSSAPRSAPATCSSASSRASCSWRSSARRARCDRSKRSSASTAAQDKQPPPDDQIASVRQAMANRDDARSAFERAEQLNGRGLMSKVDRDTADTRLKVTEANYQAALDNVRA